MNEEVSEIETVARTTLLVLSKWIALCEMDRPFTLTELGALETPRKETRATLLLDANFPVAWSVPCSYENLIRVTGFVCVMLIPSSIYNCPDASPSVPGAIASSKSLLRSSVVVFADDTRRGRMEPPLMCRGISV